MSQNSQLHLTNDSFIYACQSEFAARTKKDGSFNSHLRYEDFLTGHFKRPENPTVKDVARVVHAITKHHTQVTPQFRRQEPINLETVSYFTCAVATLFADLESACREFFGTGLPVIPENPPEYSADAPVSTCLLNARSAYLAQLSSAAAEPEKFAAFPRPEFPTLTDVQQVQIWACEVWDLIADALHSELGEYADAAMGFAYWKYQEVPAKADIDWRVRPPVGEAYAKAFKPLLRSARGDRGDRSDRGGERKNRFEKREPRTEQTTEGHAHARGEGAERGERTERSHRGEGAERGERTERSHRGEGAERGERTERSHRGERSERSPSRGDRSDKPRTREQGRHESRQHGQPPAQSSEQQLNDALNEVRQAIDALKGNAALREHVLRPNNSFIRRQQHSLAVEMGFETESRGEGRDRGVVIRLPQG